ncbi:hypothetical protein PYW08_009162 [Mythimna loreyi]|uniref:Uncharacterized protein n=1 Tax=Mythimna loreyi TaxID=667449 RepID=A0ACC2Q7U2_9NEOP|nr:hypothetical protein PYW08_009162 [Mythimna loreyi]
MYVVTFHIPNGKNIKVPLKKTHRIISYGQIAKLVLKTVKFRYVKKIGNKTRLVETIIPSLTNLIKTIEGMEAIWKIVSQRFGFDALMTRNFNQDPVENFFGTIRSYGARNNSPNSNAFEGAFKALLLNNYNSPHSGRSNCEEDSNKCVQTLEFFFTDKINSKPDTSNVPMEEEILCNEEVFL